MRKLMKRLFAFAAIMLMMVSLIPTVAFAAETKTDEKVAVYIQVPEDWSNPCVWAWDDAGNNAFEAWPGQEAEADVANDGWYYIWIPVWANHVIVNANEGSVQTEEQILEGKNAWITVSDAEQVEVSFEQQTEGEIPEYVEKFLVHAQVDSSWMEPCIWAWSAPDGTNVFESWPGYAMKDDGDGWYSAKVPVWVNSIIINGNHGEVQTEDISIDAAEVWVTVDAEGVADFSYVDPNKEVVPNITIHVSAPADWSAPCLWAWSAPDGTNVFSNWPGEALEEGENGWLVKEIPGWVNSIIVNGNEGSVQTTDISVETGKDVWVVVTDAENYEVSYEELAIEELVIDESVIEETTVETASTEESVEEIALTTASVETDTAGGNNGVVIVIVIIAIVAIIAVVVVMMSKKKRQK